MQVIRKGILQAVLILLLGGSVSWAGSGEKITVMTKNMDAGTDFGFFIANLQTNPSLGVQLTLQEVLKNDYVGRASNLAQEILAANPDVVGLQEVTQWVTPAGTIDQLQLLLNFLGGTYEPVRVNKLTDLTFPVGDGETAEFIDHDAIIRRVDSPINISNVETKIYSALVPLPIGPPPGLPVLRGWISADITQGENTLRFVTTHLESSASLYGNPDVNVIQTLQATELATTFSTSPIPVVIAGDFNSNATHTPPEQTPAFHIMQTAFVDAWSALHHGNPGFTWPLYKEDPLREHTQGPLERIDFVFTRGLNVTSVDRTGLKAPFSSDHAGIVAIIGF